jgi:LPS-assembly protein
MTPLRPILVRCLLGTLLLVLPAPTLAGAADLLAQDGAAALSGGPPAHSSSPALPAPAATPALPGTAAAVRSGALPVYLQADQLSVNQASQTYSASGRVELRQGALTLQSETLTWQPERDLAQAQGAVRVSDPSGTIQASAADYQLQTGVGTLEQGRVFLRAQNFHLGGELIEKLGEETYRVSAGTFTTCDGEVPSWKFGASRVDVTLGRYAQARNVVFYLKDLPVLYLPYVVFPVKTERESGLLLPRTGYSKQRGTELSLAYYQVIDLNMDATLYVDYLSELGVGKGLEYRYLFGEQNQGRLFGYHVGSAAAEESDHLALDWTHFGMLPGAVRLAADVEYVNNRTYFAEFGEVADEYNKDKTESVVSASRSWDKTNLTGQFKYLKDLVQSNDQTLQRLPEVRLTSVRQRLRQSPFYLGFDSSATLFWRREGTRGERLNLRPTLSGVFLPGDWLELAPTLGFRQRLYSTTEGEASQGQVDLSTRLASRFARVYAMEQGALSKLRHSIEPDLIYSYRPKVDQNDLPQFDALDDIPSANTLSLGLSNRLVGRLDTGGGARYHEFAYLRLSQEYDIEESRRDRLDPADRRQPFSNSRGELILRPTTWSLLDVDGRYDLFGDRHGWSSLGVLAGVHDGRGNSLDLDYRFQDQLTEYLQGRIATSWLKPIYLSYLQRHAVDGSRTLEKFLELEYRAQCWSLFLSFRDRLEDQEYLVSFALTGLGRVAQFGGKLGTSATD